jgi:hypothetical protein
LVIGVDAAAGPAAGHPAQSRLGCLFEQLCLAIAGEHFHLEDHHSVPSDNAAEAPKTVTAMRTRSISTASIS